MDEKTIKNILAGVIESVVNFQISMNEYLSNTITPEVLENMKNYTHNFKVFKSILITLGYPPYWDFEVPDIRMTVEIYEKHGIEEARGYLESIYLSTCNDIYFNNILIKWRTYDFLQRRIGILSEVITTHNLEYYYCSIPACIAQIEGIIVENNNHSEWLRQKHVKKYIENTLNDIDELSFDDVITEVMDTLLYETFVHGHDYSSPFSRNAILHGVDTVYGFKINSIKCLLILNYIIDRIKEKF